MVPHVLTEFCGLMDLYEKWDKWLSYVGNYIFRHNLFQYNGHYGSISFLSNCNTCYWTSCFFCPSAPYGNRWRCVDLSQISFLDLGLLYFQRSCFFFPPASFSAAWTQALILFSFLPASSPFHLILFLGSSWKEFRHEFNLPIQWGDFNRFGIRMGWKLEPAPVFGSYRAILVP